MKTLSITLIILFCILLTLSTANYDCNIVLNKVLDQCSEIDIYTLYPTPSYCSIQCAYPLIQYVTICYADTSFSCDSYSSRLASFVEMCNQTLSIIPSSVLPTYCNEYHNLLLDSDSCGLNLYYELPYQTCSLDCSYNYINYQLCLHNNTEFQTLYSQSVAEVKSFFDSQYQFMDYCKDVIQNYSPTQCDIGFKADILQYCKYWNPLNLSFPIISEDNFFTTECINSFITYFYCYLSIKDISPAKQEHHDPFEKNIFEFATLLSGNLPCNPLLSKSYHNSLLNSCVNLNNSECAASLRYSEQSECAGAVLLPFSGEKISLNTSYDNELCASSLQVILSNYCTDIPLDEEEVAIFQDFFNTEILPFDPLCIQFNDGSCGSCTSIPLESPKYTMNNNSIEDLQACEPTRCSEMIINSITSSCHISPFSSSPIDQFFCESSCIEVYLPFYRYCISPFHSLFSLEENNIFSDRVALCSLCNITSSHTIELICGNGPYVSCPSLECKTLIVNWISHCFNPNQYHYIDTDFLLLYDFCSDSSSNYTVPSSPTSLKIDYLNIDSVLLHWTPSTQGSPSTSFTVLSNDDIEIVSQVLTTSVIVSTISPCYKVVATNHIGSSSPFEACSSVTFFSSPESPTSVITQIFDSVLHIQWTPPSVPPSFSLEYISEFSQPSIFENHYANLIITSIPERNISLEKLVPLATTFVRISARYVDYSGVVSSAWSSFASSEGFITPEPYVFPPAGLMMTRIENDFFNISWIPRPFPFFGFSSFQYTLNHRYYNYSLPFSDVSNDIIPNFVSEVNQNYVISCESDTICYFLLLLPKFFVHLFRVRISSPIFSEWTSFISYVGQSLPDPVSNISFSFIDPESVTFEWGANFMDEIQLFKVKLMNGMSIDYSNFVPGSFRRFSVSPITSNMSYVLQISAINSIGWSLPTSIAFSTPKKPPSLVSAKIYNTDDYNYNFNLLLSFDVDTNAPILDSVVDFMDAFTFSPTEQLDSVLLLFNTTTFFFDWSGPRNLVIEFLGIQDLSLIPSIGLLEISLNAENGVIFNKDLSLSALHSSVLLSGNISTIGSSQSIRQNIFINSPFQRLDNLYVSNILYQHNPNIFEIQCEHCELLVECNSSFCLVETIFPSLVSVAINRNFWIQFADNFTVNIKPEIDYSGPMFVVFLLNESSSVSNSTMKVFFPFFVNNTSSFIDKPYIISPDSIEVSLNTYFDFSPISLEYFDPDIPLKFMISTSYQSYLFFDAQPSQFLEASSNFWSKNTESLEIIANVSTLQHFLHHNHIQLYEDSAIYSSRTLVNFTLSLENEIIDQKLLSITWICNSSNPFAIDITSSIFSSDLRSIIINFSLSPLLIMPVSGFMNCTDIFENTNTLGINPVCTWSNYKILTITLGPSFSIRPLDTLSFKSLHIHPQCNCFYCIHISSISKTFPISPPEHFHVPQIHLQAPIYASDCEDLPVAAISSLEGMIVVWSTSVDFLLVNSVVSSSSIIIPMKFLQNIDQLEIGIIVKNILGVFAISSISIHILHSHHPLFHSLHFDGGNYLNFQELSYSVFADSFSLYSSSCFGGLQKFSLYKQWESNWNTGSFLNNIYTIFPISSSENQTHEIQLYIHHRPSSFIDETFNLIYRLPVYFERKTGISLFFTEKIIEMGINAPFWIVPTVTYYSESEASVDDFLTTPVIWTCSIVYSGTPCFDIYGQPLSLPSTVNLTFITPPQPKLYLFSLFIPQHQKGTQIFYNLTSSIHIKIKDDMSKPFFLRLSVDSEITNIFPNSLVFISAIPENNIFSVSFQNDHFFTPLSVPSIQFCSNSYSFIINPFRTENFFLPGSKFRIQANHENSFSSFWESNFVSSFPWVSITCLNGCDSSSMLKMSTNAILEVTSDIKNNPSLFYQIGCTNNDFAFIPLNIRRRSPLVSILLFPSSCTGISVMVYQSQLENSIIPHVYTSFFPDISTSWSVHDLSHYFVEYSLKMIDNQDYEKLLTLISGISYSSTLKNISRTDDNWRIAIELRLKMVEMVYNSPLLDKQIDVAFVISPLVGISSEPSQLLFSTILKIISTLNIVLDINYVSRENIASILSISSFLFNAINYDNDQYLNNPSSIGSQSLSPSLYSLIQKIEYLYASIDLKCAGHSSYLLSSSLHSSLIISKYDSAFHDLSQDFSINFFSNGRITFANSFLKELCDNSGTTEINFLAFQHFEPYIPTSTSDIYSISVFKVEFSISDTFSSISSFSSNNRYNSTFIIPVSNPDWRMRCSLYDANSQTYVQSSNEFQMITIDMDSTTVTCLLFYESLSLPIDLGIFLISNATIDSSTGVSSLHCQSNKYYIFDLFFSVSCEDLLSLVPSISTTIAFQNNIPLENFIWLRSNDGNDTCRIEFLLKPSCAYSPPPPILFVVEETFKSLHSNSELESACLRNISCNQNSTLFDTLVSVLVNRAYYCPEIDSYKIECPIIFKDESTTLLVVLIVIGVLFVLILFLYAIQGKFIFIKKQDYSLFAKGDIELDDLASDEITAEVTMSPATMSALLDKLGIKTILITIVASPKKVLVSGKEDDINMLCEYIRDNMHSYRCIIQSKKENLVAHARRITQLHRAAL